MSDDERNDPEIGDLVGQLMMRVARRGRDRLTRAADRGRHQLELRQARRDLDDFWVRLGRTSYRLVEAGELDHPALVKARERIDELQRRIACLEEGQTATPDDRED